MPNKIFNTAVFPGPKFSSFSMDHPNMVSMKFGDCVPIYWDFMNPNDRAVFDMSQVVRLSPMLQPILNQIDITIDAFAVRLRSLGMAERNPWVYEDFFNANKNLDGSKQLPHDTLLNIGKAAGFKLGSLYDYLGFPTLDGFRKDLRRQIAAHPYLLSPLAYAENGDNDVLTVVGSCESGTFIPVYGGNRSDIEDSPISLGDAVRAVPTFDYGPNTPFEFGPFLSSPAACIIPLHLFAFIYALDPSLVDMDNMRFTLAQWTNTANLGYNFDKSYINLGGNTSDYIDSINALLASLKNQELPDYIYSRYNIDWQSIEQMWFDFIWHFWVIDGKHYAVSNTGTFVDLILSQVFTDNVGTVQSSTYSIEVGSGEVPYPSSDVGFVPSVPDGSEGQIVNSINSIIQIPLYPASAYWKIIADWYLNTGLFNPDDWYLEKCYTGSGAERVPNLAVLFGEPFKRNWNNDYFTSAFDKAQRGLAVGIPADGTIPDLRNASALQKFKERLLFAGHKFRDVIYSIFGIKMSSAIADMSEVLGRWVNPINIDTVLQTSASNAQSSLASYAGSGLAFGNKKHLLRYTAEEPTVIMFIASIRPKYAIYYQGVPKKLRRNYLMDYAIPGFSNVGEQMISNREIYADIGSYSSNNGVFGFTRRYADFMFAQGEVHGDFKDSLDSWHLARQFDSQPNLNEEFLSVRGVEDNLNRIFATTSDSVDKFYCNFFFNGSIIRSIPKRIYYDL